MIMMMNNKLHIFTIIICSLVLISCQPKETSENYLVLRDGLKYERNSLEPFTGITRGQEQVIKILEDCKKHSWNSDKVYIGC